jgi:hypothetical protein
MKTARNNTRRLGLLATLFITAVAVFATGPAPAAAAPALKVSTITPDYVTPGSLFPIYLAYQNVGDEALTGPLTLKITFPDGAEPSTNWQEDAGPLPECSTTGQQIECTVEVTGLEPGVQRRARVFSTVEASASGPLPGGEIEIFGGGAADTFSEPFSLVAGQIGPFAIKSLGLDMSPTRPGGSPAQAASDPMELTTRVSLLSEAKLLFGIPNPLLALIAPPEHFRDVVAHVPPGLVGNPLATPVRCAQAQLPTQAVLPSGLKSNIPDCPPDSQVGLAQLNFNDIVPVYNLVPPPGSPAAFGFFYNSVVVTLLARVRPSDHGIDIVTERAVSSVPIPKFEVTLWGVPSNPSHDRLRGVCLHGSNTGYNAEIGSNTGECALQHRTDLPFLRTPTSCPGTSLGWEIEMNTYQHVGNWVHKDTTTPAIEGCGSVPFDPSLSLAPTEKGTHSPSGLDVELSMPQDHGPDGLAQADLRAATVALPQGIALNPPSADGLQACTDDQLRLGLEGPSNCPDASKLGSLQLTTPLLEDPIGGSVFLRSQASNDPASGDLFRLAIEIRSDERGVAIKLPGQLKVDPNTGQLTTVFDDLPQLPFESAQLHLKTGPRAPLSTPSTCGTYTSHAVLTGWNGATETADPSFTVDQNCDAPGFAPGFQAGVADNTAGAFSPFTLRVTREDGQPNLSRIDATLPEGELAKLAGVPVCGDAQAASGDCPPASRIGHVLAGIGEGPSPLFLPQAGKAPTAVYLAGPYRGAPYSVLTRVPAQAGPFDLGQVLVRSALHVDPVSTRASVLSDPLPQIFQGVPVSYRDVRVNVDRPEFTINPTDCEPMTTTGALTSIAGQSAAVEDRFQVADCAALGFKPSLRLSLSGGSERGDHPALRALLKARPGDANIARAQVTLPRSEFLDQGHIRTVCTRVQFAADSCPKGSIYGHARATTPLLDQPLSGPVYLRSSSNKLPDLVADLGGQVEVELVGRIDSVRGGIRTTFASVPDAPVSRFVLTMQGGKKGLLVNSTDLCNDTHRASVKMDAQSGRIRDFAPVLRAGCGEGRR